MLPLTDINLKQQKASNSVERKPAVVDWVSPLPPSVSSANIDDIGNDMVPAAMTTTATGAAHSSKNNGYENSSSGSNMPTNGNSNPRPVSLIANYGSLSTNKISPANLSSTPVRPAAVDMSHTSAKIEPARKSPGRHRLKHILTIAACCVVVFPLVWVMALVGPAKSGIDCDRQSDIRRPHRETLTPTLLFTIITTLVAIILLVGTEFVMCRTCKDAPTKRMRFSLCARWALPSWLYFAVRNFVAYAFGVHMTQGAVFLIRMMVAIPRPDWWSVCQPVFPGGRCPEHQYTTNYECRNKNTRQIWDASRSFPSGHVTFITFNAVFILIFLERRCRAPRLRYDSVRYLLRTIEFWLFVAVFFTSAERVQANSHHPSDVYSGALFGIVGAIFASKLLLFAPDGINVNGHGRAETNHRPRHGAVDVDNERGNPSRNSFVSTVAQ